MNDTKKLVAFLRTVIREGVLTRVDHPVAEAARRFYADVDLLGTATAEQWFAANGEQADKINAVYEAYNAEEPVEEVAQPVTEADNAISEIEKLQARIKALEDAQAQPVPEIPPAAEAQPTPEA